MVPPNLTPEQVASIIPQASDVHFLSGAGGQKVVFTGIIDGQKYALKFMSQNPTRIVNDEESLDEVVARAQREVETMGQCTSPHIVRMGPLGLQRATVNGEPILYFSEEFIEGSDLKQYKNDAGNLSIPEIVLLAQHISDAIRELWQLSKIHRDIKPGNIMRRSSTGDFVLLDMGFVFDIRGESYSVGPVGTLIYFSPEHMNFANRRTSMDFRSDLFSLGIVLYEMATGQHPFITQSTMSSYEVIGNIAKMIPTPPINLRHDLPQSLNDIIMRLLAKHSALRYRTIDRFQQALRQVITPGR